MESELIKTTAALEFVRRTMATAFAVCLRMAKFSLVKVNHPFYCPPYALFCAAQYVIKPTILIQPEDTEYIFLGERKRFKM